MSTWPLKWGEIIAAIESLAKENPDIQNEGVYFDFCLLSPTGVFYCDRGNYSHRSIQCGVTSEFPSQMTVKQFLLSMKAEIGKERKGWKGGTYTCRKDTEATVTLEASYSPDTRIFAVEEFYGGVVLVTGRWE